VETQRQAKQGQERKDEPEPQLEELEPKVIHGLIEDAAVRERKMLNFAQILNGRHARRYRPSL